VRADAWGRGLFFIMKKFSKKFGYLLRVCGLVQVYIPGFKIRWQAGTGQRLLLRQSLQKCR